jgi:ATP-dependent DNA ligase
LGLIFRFHFWLEAALAIINIAPGYRTLLPFGTIRRPIECQEDIPAVCPANDGGERQITLRLSRWIFEIKLDGYRAITVFDATGKPHLWSRNGLALEPKFPAIAKAVSKLKLRSTILGGEVVAVDENGIPRFQLLQRFQKPSTATTLYYVFDVLWHNGANLTGKPILERRSVLECIIKPAADILLGQYVEAERKALFALTKEKGMEGIIAKRKDSIYRPGKRLWGHWMTSPLHYRSCRVVPMTIGPGEKSSLFLGLVGSAVGK